jgi:UPF0176 protein
MFCTGGIRCEKSTAFLKSEGVDEVFHLKGGILSYLESTPPRSLWRGECFVFDERVAVGHGLAPGTHALCRGCRMPVSPATAPRRVMSRASPARPAMTPATKRPRPATPNATSQATRARELGIAHVGAVMGQETPD